MFFEDRVIGMSVTEHLTDFGIDSVIVDSVDLFVFLPVELIFSAHLFDYFFVLHNLTLKIIIATLLTLYLTDAMLLHYHS